MGYIKGHDRYQTTLFPETIDDYITENNQVRVIDVFIDSLNVVALGFTHAIPCNLGRPAYDPKDLLKLYLYGFLNRIRSSRRLEHEAIRNIEVIWLLKKLRPDFKTIADFRKDNKKALTKVFRDFTKLCDEWDLLGKELVAIDGSKYRAVNSRRNNFSKKKLDRHIQYINEKIEKYMDDLDAGDEAEKGDRKPDAEEIHKRIQELKARKEKYTGFKQQLEDSGQNEISTTDPDARLMCNNNNNVDVSYNVQTTVDGKHKLIADFKVTTKPNDLGELDNMALRVKKMYGKTFTVLADKGYYKATDLKRCVENGLTTYVTKQIFSNGTGDRDFYLDRFQYDKEKNVYLCPAGKELHYSKPRKSKGKVIGYDYNNFQACSNCTFKERCTKSKKGRVVCRHVDQDFLDQIDIQTEEHFETYKLRQMIVEHPFGTIKRGWGAYYFLTKGKNSVSAEIALAYLSYNFKRVLNILGAEEMIRRLKVRGELALV